MLYSSKDSEVPDTPSFLKKERYCSIHIMSNQAVEHSIVCKKRNDIISRLPQEYILKVDP